MTDKERLESLSKLDASSFVYIGDCSEITQLLVHNLVKRDRVGKTKYGTSLDRKDLSKEDWLEHMTEELLDAAGYAQCIKRELK